MGKTGQRCKVCAHPRLVEIDHAVARGVALRIIGNKFDVSPDSLWRHRKNHLSVTAKAAALTGIPPSAVDLEQLERREGESLLNNVVMQRARLQKLVDQAMDDGDVRAATQAEKAITCNLEFVARLLGQLVQRHEVKRENILISSDYLALRAGVLRALAPFPEAKRAVAAELFRMEKAAADTIEKTGQAPVIETPAEVLQ